MEFLQHNRLRQPVSLEKESIDAVNASSFSLFETIRSIGHNPALDEFEKRKLGIFNQLNFLQLVSGTIGPIIGLMHHQQLPSFAWIIASLPALVSVLVLYLNHRQQYELSLLSYFILYPFITGIIYFNGFNLGVELNFILYGVLSVFFLQDIGYMLFSLSLSMISYFVLSVLLKRYQYQLEQLDLAYYYFNQGLALIFIFYGLFLIKKENTSYQFSILSKNRALHTNNLQIEEQKKEIEKASELLKTQTEELTELNELKNKLFSIISHDLKAPMYALRNVFRNIQQFDIPAEEIKTMIPDVTNDLNYTVGLMENLLQWAKSQMEFESIHIEAVDVSRLINEVLQVMHLQAASKNILLQSTCDKIAVAACDRDMVHLVLRNLISNSVKFTPEGGKIWIGIHEHPSFVEIFVQDTGKGITEEGLLRINENKYYSTKGTASEAGTGLGLMLCREFLAKNGGRLRIESKPDMGSTFSFTLPVAADH
ncbi:MAG TPA: HAMP domain-containing sensor histidine kinase [Chitinophagaceae bacterium]|nr:HAMP domain-containing sensor histidine kinase [Chitinophagaceae bacterium]